VIKVSDGSDGAGNTLVSFGALGSTDKALGSRNSSESTITYGVEISNQTGGAVDDISISYTLEQWYGGTAADDGLAFSYSLDAASLSDSEATWQNVAALNANAPKTSFASTAQLDGNDPANQVTKEATFSFSQSWEAGATVWLRWQDANVSDLDHGIAIDDLQIDAASGTTPTAAGGIEYQFWPVPSSDPGYSPENPERIHLMPTLESPRTTKETFTVVLRGWIRPEISGNYLFHLTGDDEADLRLSTDADPVNATSIATIASATAFRDWANATQSAPISLVAGEAYYIELQHEQSTGDNHASVAWTPPGHPLEGPIPANYLSPFTSQSAIEEARLSRLLDNLYSSASDTKRGYNNTKEGFYYPLHNNVRTRESLQYALALLDGGDSGDLARAEGIIAAVIAEQDTDETSGTYGNWPKNMGIGDTDTGDANWAAFCGLLLAEILLEHDARLSPALVTSAETALLRACDYIQRINLGNHSTYGFRYSNIAFLSTATLVTAAEYFPADSDLNNFTNDRVVRLYDYTIDQGGFPEFNSPTYMPVTLAALGKMRHLASNSPHQARFATLMHMAWMDVAENFHFPSMQWAGATARSYNFLRPAAELLQEITGNYAFSGEDSLDDFPATYVDSKYLADYLPPEAAERFSKPLNLETNSGSRAQNFPADSTAPGKVDRLFLVGDAPLGTHRYMTNSYTLGSATRGDFWVQRQGLLAHFGQAPHEAAYLRVRFLKDGSDFAAAHHFTAQSEDLVAGAVNIASNGGENHPNSGLINGQFQASQLRLRFEYRGANAATAWTLPAALNDPAKLALPANDIHVRVPYVQFDGLSPYWETSQSGDITRLDLVLYDGTESTFDLSNLSETFLQYLLSITDPAGPAPTGATRLEDGMRILESGSLQLSVPAAANLDINTLHTSVLSLSNFNGLPVVYGTSEPTRETGTDPGRFILERTGSTTTTLNVSYALGGSATSHADYVLPPLSATFPIGADSIEIEIEAVNDAELEGTEEVKLTLLEGAEYTAGEVENLRILDDDLFYPSVLHRTLTPGENASLDLTFRNPYDQPLRIDLLPETNGGAYRYADSDAANGPDYIWNDIAQPENEITGMSVNLDTPVALPFSFPFYGNSYDTVYLNRRGGYISFVDQPVVFTPRSIPNKNNPAYSIFFLWAENWDQYVRTAPDPSAQFWAAEDADGNFVIQHKMQLRQSGVHYHATVQTILQPNGTVLIHYQSIDPEAYRDFTVGVQAENTFENMEGLEISHEPDVPYLRDAFSIRIRPAATLIDPQILSIDLAPRWQAGDSASLPIILRAGSLPEGQHFDTLQMTANHPDLNGLQLPVIVNIDSNGPYGHWKDTHFLPAELANPTISGDLVDPDSDGLGNELEFRLGTDPRQADAAPLAMENNGASLQLEFPTRGQPTRMELKTSTDLIEWNQSDLILETRHDLGDGTEIHRYSIPADAPKRFFRLEPAP